MIDADLSFSLFSFVQTCSQLIKAGLKLSLQAKRKTSTGDSSGGETSSCKYIKKDEDSSDDDIDSKSPTSGLSVSEPFFQFRSNKPMNFGRIGPIR